MSTPFGSMADEFYTSSRLFLKLDMPLERDTVLHFFEQIRKAFPGMTRFHRREDGRLFLEEPADAGRSRRWLRLDPASLRFGHFAPAIGEDVRKLGDAVLRQAPYHLTFSELDFDYMEVIYGFDLEYRGNHDQLLAETLWANHPLAGFLMGDSARHVVDAQPYVGIALTPECDVQAYLEVKSRTGTFEVRTGDYETQPLGVFLTVRKYWNVGVTQPLVETHRAMFALADELAADVVVPTLVNPLAQAIASRS